MATRRKLFLGALLGAGLVLAVTVSPSLGDATPPASTARGGDFQFKSALDNSFCMDVNESGIQPTLIVSQCTAAISERFTLSDGADGRNLVIDSRGRCLSRGAKLAKDFYAVAIAQCTYQAKERWRFTVVGAFTQPPNRCFDIPRAAAGVEVHLVPCEPVNSQFWKLAQ